MELPQHGQTKQRVAFTLILEGKKGDWTEGTISNIFEDAENRIKNVEYFKFNNYSAMKKEVLQVRLYNDIAIVITRGKNIGHYLDKPFDAEQWVTNIYKKINSEWMCILTQEAPVSCE